MTDKKQSLSDSLKKLEEITAWFDAQDEVDVEKGLGKVKEGAALLTTTKKQLTSIENEFSEVKKSLEG